MAAETLFDSFAADGYLTSDAFIRTTAIQLKKGGHWNAIGSIGWRDSDGDHWFFGGHTGITRLDANSVRSFWRDANGQTMELHLSDASGPQVSVTVKGADGSTLFDFPFGTPSGPASVSVSMPW